MCQHPGCGKSAPDENELFRHVQAAHPDASDADRDSLLSIPNRSSFAAFRTPSPRKRLANGQPACSSSPVFSPLPTMGSLSGTGYIRKIMSPVGEQDEAMAVEHQEYGRVRVFTAESLEAFAQLDNWTVPLERLQLDVRMSSIGERFLQEEDGVDSVQDVDLDWKADLSDEGSEKLQVKIQCCGTGSKKNSELRIWFRTGSFLFIRDLKKFKKKFNIYNF
jgi:hypothetical protein